MTANLLIRILLCCFALTSSSLAAELGERRYRLPLVQPFVLHRAHVGFTILPDHGTHYIVREEGRSDAVPVPHVDRVATRDPLVFGSSKAGFFVLDARQLDAKPQTFVDADAWRNALRSAGIDGPDAMLATPDALAAALPPRTIRPWDYRYLNGLLGLDDSTWCGIAQLVCLAVAAAVGRFVSRSRSSIWGISFLGAFGAMVAHILYDGQGAFLLLGMTPIVYLFATVARDDLDGDVRPAWRPPAS